MKPRWCFGEAYQHRNCVELDHMKHCEFLPECYEKQEEDTINLIQQVESVWAKEVLIRIYRSGKLIHSSYMKRVDEANMKGTFKDYIAEVI